MKKILILALSAFTIANASLITNPAYAAIKVKDIPTAINSIKTAEESRTGYVRSKFKHWSASKTPGCDSRKAVIIEESLVKPKVEKGCTLTGGSWLSLYDNVKVDNASKLDVDHMVPLAEAWDSGASAWSPEKREMYANDMSDPRHLVAVTGASNRSKSDRDPSEWIPTNKDYVCKYLTDWVSIKVRWSLSMDTKEKEAILAYNKSYKCNKTGFTVDPVQ